LDVFLRFSAVFRTIVPTSGVRIIRCSGVDRPHRRPRRRGGVRALAKASRRGTRGSPGSAASVPTSAGKAGHTQGNPWPCSQVPPGHRTRDARVRNSRTSAVADPMILWEGWADRSLTSRSEVRIRRRVEARPRGRGSAAPKHAAAAPTTKVAAKETSRVADCAGSSRCPARRPQSSAPSEANLPTEVIGIEVIASHRAKPIAAREAGHADRSKSCRRRSWRRIRRSRGRKPSAVKVARRPG